MQSSHDALRYTILSNPFVTSSRILNMDALSEQVCQAGIFTDTDLIYLHCCDLSVQFDFTVPSLPFLRLNVVYGHFSFVNSLVERRLCMFPLNKRNLDKLNGVRSPCIVRVISSVIFQVSTSLCA